MDQLCTFVKKYWCLPVLCNSCELDTNEYKKNLSKQYTSIGYLNVGTDPKEIRQNLDAVNNFYGSKNIVKVMSYNIYGKINNSVSCHDSTRGKRISQIFLKDQPHFICIQKADQIKDELENCILEEKYNYLFMETDTSQIKENYDGLQTLYDSSRFDLITEKRIKQFEIIKKFDFLFDKECLESFEKNKNILHLMIYEDKSNYKQCFCLCNTRFYCPEKNESFIRFIQMIIQFNLATDFISRFDRINNIKCQTPIVIAGDFTNESLSDGDYLVNNLITQASQLEIFALKFKELSADKSKKNLAWLLSPDLQKNFNYKNSYNQYTAALFNDVSYASTSDINKDDKNYDRQNSGKTNAKSDKQYQCVNTCFTKQFKGVMDHIFYSDTLKLVQLRKLPNNEDLNKAGLESFPNKIFPSNHVPIGAIFKYNISK